VPAAKDGVEDEGSSIGQENLHEVQNRFIGAEWFA